VLTSSSSDSWPNEQPINSLAAWKVVTGISPVTTYCQGCDLKLACRPYVRVFSSGRDPAKMLCTDCGERLQ